MLHVREFARADDCIVLGPAPQSSPSVVTLVRDVTEEPRIITRIFIGSAVLWSDTLFDVFQYVRLFGSSVSLSYILTKK